MTKSICVILAVTLSVITFGTGCGAAAAAKQPDAAADFTLTDFLGRDWRNECVRFPLGGATREIARSGKALVGPDGAAVAYQLVDGSVNGKDDKDSRIAFIASLGPFETRHYHFGDNPASAATDLKLEETAEQIRLTNGQIGVAIAKKFKPGAGPIEQIRLTSGKWVGASRLDTTQALKDYRAEIVARGPVFAEVACRSEFADGHKWEMRFRLQAGEPVVLVDESFSLADASSFTLALGADFSPQTCLYRYGASGPDGFLGKNMTRRLDAAKQGAVFVLEPWLHWWGNPDKGTWFALYNDKDPDLLAIAAVSPGVWADPDRKAPAVPRFSLHPPKTPSSPDIPVTFEKNEARATFPLFDGRRRWTIQAHRRDATLAILKDESASSLKAPLPQQYQIKYGDFPLDMVKDYVLDWKGDHDNYPRLFLTKASLAAFRTTFQADAKTLEAYRRAPVSMFALDGPIAYYLGTGDAELGKNLSRTAVGWVQESVDTYLHQESQVALGFAPHHHANSFFPTLNLADAVLASEQLSPELRARVRAQIAFLGYLFDRDDFWSPERRYSANPNMTTTVRASQMAIACVIPSHPQASAWMKRAMQELKYNELDHWSDANGGWLEAPHYAMVSYDYLLGCFLMARNAGFEDHCYDPKMKKVIEWFAKISTPPDSRLSNHRHEPPLGNTYMREASGEFGAVAYLWKDKDPAFAAEMQWMYRQQGSIADPGTGGFYPTLAGYRSLMLDPTIPEKAPSYASEWFPSTGVVLRNGFATPRETQLHMIAGTNHDHYDLDSGSITLWGKGRLLSDDFGYNGQAPGSQHSMLLAPSAPEGGILNVKTFAPGKSLDYVHGVKAAWDRQIAFVKDADPLAPNYFVIRDSLQSPASGTLAPGSWRLYLTARKVNVDGGSVRAEGKDDVDLDIFFAAPTAVKLKTEDLSVATFGYEKGRYGQVTTTQTALVAPVQNESIVAVLVPRLQTEKAAVFTSLADGKGVKVQTAVGTDYVFVAQQPFSFHGRDADGDIAFEGTVGAIQLRAKRSVLSLGEAGSIAAKGQTLKSDKAASQEW